MELVGGQQVVSCRSDADHTGLDMCVEILKQVLGALSVVLSVNSGIFR